MKRDGGGEGPGEVQRGQQGDGGRAAVLHDGSHGAVNELRDDGVEQVRAVRELGDRVKRARRQRAPQRATHRVTRQRQHRHVRDAQAEHRPERGQVRDLEPARDVGEELPVRRRRREREGHGEADGGQDARTPQGVHGAGGSQHAGGRDAGEERPRAHPRLAVQGVEGVGPGAEVAGDDDLGVDRVEAAGRHDRGGDPGEAEEQDAQDGEACGVAPRGQRRDEPRAQQVELLLDGERPRPAHARRLDGQEVRDVEQVGPRHVRVVVDEHHVEHERDDERRPEAQQAPGVEQAQPKATRGGLLVEQQARDEGPRQDEEDVHPEVAAPERQHPLRAEELEVGARLEGTRRVPADVEQDDPQDRQRPQAVEGSQVRGRRGEEPKLRRREKACESAEGGG